MPSEAITAATRPPFPTYLLPSFNIPLSSHFRSSRHRQSFTSSASASSSIFSSPSLCTSSTSPAWSENTTPSSSPPHQGYFNVIAPSALFMSPLPGEGDEGLLERPRLSRTHPDTLKCSSCATDIAFASQIVSKGFTGRHGRAYLVSAPVPPDPNEGGQTKKEKEKEKEREGNLVNTKVGRSVNRQLVTGAHVVADISCLVCNSVLGWKYVDAKEQAQRYKIGKFILETRRVVGGKMWEDVTSKTMDPGWGGPEIKDLNVKDEVVFDSEDEDECEDLFTGVWDAESARRRRERGLGRHRVDV